MICPNCKEKEGCYSHVEDFNPGGDPELSYYTSWTCYNCGHWVNDWENGFEYPD